MEDYKDKKTNLNSNENDDNILSNDEENNLESGENTNLQIESEDLTNKDETEEIIENELETQIESINNSDSKNIVSSQVKTVEKVSLNSSLIIAGGILGLILIGVLVFTLFLNSTIKGTWCEQKGDITTYYTFNDKGEFIITSGSVSMINKYTMDVLEKDRITIIDANGSGTADVFYKVDGNSISGKTLTVTNEEGKEIIKAVSSSLPNVIVKDVDFKPYEKIVGEWINDDAGVTFIFNKDGTTKIDFTTQIIEGTYVITEEKDKTKITIKYYTTFDGVIQTAEYTFKCGTKELTLETAASSITLNRK